MVLKKEHDSKPLLGLQILVLRRRYYIVRTAGVGGTNPHPAQPQSIYLECCRRILYFCTFLMAVSWEAVLSFIPTHRFPLASVYSLALAQESSIVMHYAASISLRRLASP
jgi:hypothetical protein